MCTAAGNAVRVCLAILLALLLPVLTLPFAPPALAEDGWDYPAERDALLGELPADPAQAAMALVDDIYSDDFGVATIATMELLRRAGIPILNLDDKVVALPDDLVLAHAAVAGELVPILARSIRAADFFTLDDVDSLLVDSGLFAEPLPLDVLAGGLGRWGKPSKDPEAPAAPSEVVTAGAAVRALGAKRGQVYYSGAVVAEAPESVTLDALQVVLIFGHLSSPTYHVVQASASRSPFDGMLGVGVARAAGGFASNCQTGLDFYDQMEQMPWWLEGLDKNVYEFLMSALKEASHVPTSIPKPGSLIGAANVKGIKVGADQISAIITTVLWMLGIRLELQADPTHTHFGPSGHQGANAGKDVTVTAHLHFKFPGLDEGLSANAVACLKLLTDIDAFENKPLSGFKVRWSLAQPTTASGQGKLLAPLRAYENDFFTGGSGGGTTDSGGNTRVILEPAYERNPGKGVLGKGRATVIASVDKDDLPIKLKDFIGLTNPAQFAFEKIFDLANSAIRRLGLPKERIAVPVEYHGGEIITIEGHATLYALYYLLRINIKLWTCEGLKGRWQGTTGFAGKRQFFGDTLSKVFKLPPDVNLEQPENFSLDLTNGFDVAQIMLASMELEVSLNKDTNPLTTSTAIDLAQGRGRVIGDAELTVGGYPVGPLGYFDGRSTTLDVREYRPGERNDLCPNSGEQSYFPSR